MNNPSTPSDDHNGERWRHMPSEADLFVYCSACGKKKPDEIICENIEEAFMGGDMLTFKCKECNESRKSYVLQ
tara:strand:- start:46 stop:264 length:219 start_codon:yes stop_codon:yes gene_type:complete